MTKLLTSYCMSYGGAQPTALSRGRDNTLKDVFERLSEYLCDLKSNLKGWRVFSAFYRVYGLSAHADLVGKSLLRHLAVQKSKRPNLVLDDHFRAGHF